MPEKVNSLNLKNSFVNVHLKSHRNKIEYFVHKRKKIYIYIYLGTFNLEIVNI